MATAPKQPEVRHSTTSDGTHFSKDPANIEAAQRSPSSVPADKMSATLYDYPKHPFLLSAEDTAAALGTDLDKGLSSQQVEEAKNKYPRNEFEVGGSVSWYAILSKQFFNAMILVCLFNPSHLQSLTS